MISAKEAISRTRRDLLLGVALKVLFPLAVFGCFMLETETLRLVCLLIVVGGWVAMGLASARRAQLVAMSSNLIAAGRFEEAEQQIDLAIRSFSPFSTAKLRPLHHLALLRHAQKRWQETALLCQELLGHRRTALRGLSNPARLILTDALLEMGELHRAYESLAILHREQLSLPEVLHLTVLQLDYSSRIGAWSSMLENLPSKLQLIEIMPSDAAAGAAAMLGLAASRLGRDDWARWLGERARLLADVKVLTDRHPILRQFFDPNAPGVGMT